MRFPRSKSYSIHIPPILAIFPTITLKACTVLHLSVLSFIYSLSVVRLMSTVLVNVFVRCPSVNYQILKDENNKSQWWQTMYFELLSEDVWKQTLKLDQPCKK